MHHQRPEHLHVARVTSEAQIRSCYHVMQQLRPHLTDQGAFVKQVQRQIQEGYHLVAVQDNQEISALVGFRFLEFLAWGKILYIDDLVCDATKRRNGHGGKILKWVIHQAQEAKCNQVHLDSGPQRYEAHKLYLNHGFKIMGHHFALDFNNP